MVTDKFTRVEPDDPTRCQGLAGKGSRQCPFQAIEGTPFCPRHGGNKTSASEVKQNQRTYLLSMFKERTDRQADNSKLKSLREDVAVLRMMLETKLNKCTDDQQLLMQSGQIIEMVREITKTVKVCHELELSLNTVLDKAQAEAWVANIGQILSNIITDPDILEMVAEDMMESLNATFT